VLIRVESLGHTYTPGTPLAHAALRGVNLVIGPGERVGLVGRTGSGKSTLVQHIAGLLSPTQGQVLLDGVPAHVHTASARAVRRRLGLAFQHPEDQIFEQTVWREVAFGPRNLGLNQAEIAARVRWALEMVGLNSVLESRSPFTLSGGEMRRVALASVMAMRPETLILDEPTAGLDPRGRCELLTHLRAWQAETGSTLVLVSHSLDELARVVERVIVLNRGQVAADGPTRQVLSDNALLSAAGLDVPQLVMLQRLLHEKGWDVRTDWLLLEDVIGEIIRVGACAGREAA
jgi:energy-coupling factor transport system ATP-binding protein